MEELTAILRFEVTDRTLPENELDSKVKEIGCSQIPMADDESGQEMEGG